MRVLCTLLLLFIAPCIRILGRATKMYLCNSCLWKLRGRVSGNLDCTRPAAQTGSNKEKRLGEFELASKLVHYSPSHPLTSIQFPFVPTRIQWPYVAVPPAFRRVYLTLFVSLLAEKQSRCTSVLRACSRRQSSLYVSFVPLDLSCLC